ncbi:uncharacterized protein OCT59_004662 [Rhizophagus irregularis]|uniref:uncharacterized protein n=1 Tax=Rhizophagus irregularis TaxID=588596 RepID=UPI00331C394F|nr:hypothetical protein OCT59_004662 [Rhizophagus irregularis]
MEEIGKTVNYVNDQDESAVDPNIVTEFVQDKHQKLANSSVKQMFEDKVVELRSNDKKLTKPYLTGVSDGYLRVMTCKIDEQVKSKTSDHQSRVNEIVATTSAHDSDDNFSDTSDDTDYFKEEEGANDSIEEGSKADDDDDVYFHSEDEEEKGTNEEVPNMADDDSDCSHDNDSDDDDGYNRYDGYGGYDSDRGYYYRDGRYERKTSPMMSPIISPVTA